MRVVRHQTNACVTLSFSLSSYRTYILQVVCDPSRQEAKLADYDLKVRTLMGVRETNFAPICVDTLGHVRHYIDPYLFHENLYNRRLMWDEGMKS